MMTHGDIIPDLKDKWLQDLVEKVAHQINSRKEMEILSYEIGKAANSAENLNDRLSAAKKRFDKVNRRIHEIPPPSSCPTGKTSRPSRRPKNGRTRI